MNKRPERTDNWAPWTRLLDIHTYLCDHGEHFRLRTLQFPFLLRSVSLPIRKHVSLATLLTLSPLGQHRSYHGNQVSDFATPEVVWNEFYPCSSSERTTVRESHRKASLRSTSESRIKFHTEYSRTILMESVWSLHAMLSLAVQLSYSLLSCESHLQCSVPVPVLPPTAGLWERPWMPSVSQIWRHAAA